MEIVEKRITDLVGYKNNPRNNKKAVSLAKAAKFIPQDWKPLFGS